MMIVRGGFVNFFWPVFETLSSSMVKKVDAKINYIFSFLIDQFSISQQLTVE